MNIGFIGTGALTAAIVTGLGNTADASPSIWLSPRNRKIAADLANRYPHVQVATDNQTVLDQSDTIVLAVRPQVAHEVLPPLRFRRDHHVITLIGVLSREQIADMVAPAERVVKALPMPMIAHGMGGTLICPPDPVTAGFFGRIGEVIEVDDSDEFDALSVASATFATYFKYLETIQRWLEAHDVASPAARHYITALYEALAAAPKVAPDADFMHLAKEYATRGGINEQVARSLSDAKVFDTFAASMDAVYQRITANDERAGEG